MAAAKNKTSKISLCAIVSALAVALMLVSRLFTVADYSITALCGLLMGVIVIECGAKWALASYVATALLAVLIAPGECSILFVAFFGYYPVVKVLLDKMQIVLGWILKLALFNAVIVSLLYLLRALAVPMDDIEFLNPVLSIVLVLVLLNIVFVLYDILFGRLMLMYMNKIHSRIYKFLNK